MGVLLHPAEDSTIDFVDFLFNKWELEKEKHAETSGDWVASAEAGKKMGSSSL